MTGVRSSAKFRWDVKKKGPWEKKEGSNERCRVPHVVKISDGGVKPAA